MIIDYSFLFDLVRDCYSMLSYNNKSNKVIIPLRYFIDFTYRCNHSCPYCYIGKNRNMNELTSDEWKKVIDQIPRFGIISFIGGEPLFRKDFIEVYEYASKRCPGHVNLYTNALLIDEDIIQSFIKNKLLELSFSLDGIGDAHDKSRNYPGAYETIINNVTNLQNQAKGKTRIIYDVKTVLHADNIEQMPLLYELCEKNDWEFLSITFLRTVFLKQCSDLRPELTSEFNCSREPVKLYFDMNKFKEAFKEIDKMSKYYKTKLRWAPKFKPFNNVKDIEKFFEESEKGTPLTEMFNPCLFPFSNLYINPEGNVYPCLSVNMGSVREKPLMAIINSPEFIKFREQLKKEKLFTACQMCCEPHFKKEFLKNKAIVHNIKN